VVVQSIDPDTLQPGEVVVVQRGMMDASPGDGIQQLAHAGETLTASTRRANQLVGRVIAIERADQTIDLRPAGARSIGASTGCSMSIAIVRCARTMSSAPSTRLHGLPVLINRPFRRWCACCCGDLKTGAVQRSS
jgi:hypothetical protein